MNRTAAEQGRDIAAGKLDPVAQVEAYLEKSMAHPARDRIWARLTPERARSEAIAAHDRARNGLSRGPLDGVAISWKDNIDSANCPTEAGSRLLTGRLPDRDAVVLANAAQQGGICLGKTHMTELAFSGLGLNPMTATPPNAVLSELAPGGSSSGAAVSVALGLAAGAVGSDTGGSIRLPAAWNDLVGFKPAHGRLPMGGVVPLCARFDCAGPIARTVEDCALIFAMLAGESAPDLRDATLAGTRLLVLEGTPFDSIRAEPEKGFETALGKLSGAGARIARRKLACVETAMGLSGTLFAPEAYGLWKDRIEAAPDKMYPPILERFRGGAAVAAADYVAGWAQLDALRAEYLAATAGYDAVLLPTCPILPPDAARLESDNDYFVTENILALRNTRVGNLMGTAAITLPTGYTMTGLMMMLPPGNEARLLRLAHAAEAALG